VAQATIADITEKENKSANFGKIGMAFGLGLILGPFLGGLLSSNILPVFSAPLPFFFTAALSFTTLIYSKYALKETSPMEDKKINWLKPFTQLKKGYNLPGLKKLFTTNFFYFAGFNFFTTFIPVYLVKNLGFTQFQTGNFFLYIGILLITGQGIIVPKLFNRFKEEKVMPITLFLTGLFVFLQPLAGTLILFLLFSTLFSFNNSITQVSLNTLVSNNASEKNQGLALGTNQSVRALGNAFPSMLSGIAAAIATPSTPLTIAGIIIMTTAAAYKITQ
jgi:Arabinose efflux permease